MGIDRHISAIFIQKNQSNLKSLLIVRHAKSSWDIDTDDFNRPLNHRGEKDAPEMANRLKAKGIVVDAFISSPAKRAITTARYFAEAIWEKRKVVEISTLYEPTIQSFYNVVENLNDADQVVAIFAHNPAITHFVNSLTTTQIDDMPTCGVFAIKAEIEHWKDFVQAKKVFWFFDYPKA